MAKKKILYSAISFELLDCERNYSATVSVATTAVLSQPSQAVLSFSHFVHSVHSVHSVASVASFVSLFEQAHAAAANIVATTAKVIRTFFIVLNLKFLNNGAKVRRKIENTNDFLKIVSKIFICLG